MWSHENMLFTDSELVELLKAISKGDIITLDGPSGCGKSRLLKQLKQSGKKVDVYSSEDLKEHIMWRFRHFPDLPSGLPGLGIIVVEDIDFLESTKSIQIEAAYLIEQALTENGVIITGIRLRERIPTIINTFFRHNRNIAVRFSDGKQRMYLFDDDVTDAIRALRVSIATSKVSRVPQVREKMMALQRRIAEGQSVVMDGRDIGTKVLPNATLKIYLTASAEVRARRRYEQLEAAFELPFNFDQVLEEIVRRDDLDTHRAVSPLRPAEDSVLIDNTAMTLDETYALIKKLALEAINGGADS